MDAVTLLEEFNCPSGSFSGLGLPPLAPSAYTFVPSTYRPAFVSEPYHADQEAMQKLIPTLGSPSTNLIMHADDSLTPYQPASGEAVSAQTKIIQNNPGSLANPAPGTTPVQPAAESVSFVSNLIKTLGVGATVYQQGLIANEVTKARKQGTVVYVPTPSYNYAQMLPTSPWLYAGAGVAALAIIGLVIYSARKS